jgi:protein-S-isoprenylcysteine O-methyltransferase Ste14
MDSTARVIPLPVLRSLLRLAIVNGLMTWGLFWTAGRLDWPQAWWCMSLLFGGLVLSLLYLWRVNPELIAARSRFGTGTKTWDFLMIAILIAGTAVLLWVAGFDERFGWTGLPPWGAVVGNLMMLLGMAGATWAQGVNRHFEPSVRIQSERGHAVIDSGPYSLVRHPGYASGALILVGMAMALGSLWALIPALLVIASLALRTVLEERTLRAGLPGYAEYARRVRHRWLPGVW